eukprot:COSAG01_NODE_3369_length_6183_cov_20.176857_7_plen_53_part_00
MEAVLDVRGCGIVTGSAVFAQRKTERDSEELTAELLRRWCGAGRRGDLLTTW